MRKPLRRQGSAPAKIATDKPRSYGAALAEPGVAARHEQASRKNTRAEVSNRPVRRRECKMQRRGTRTPPARTGADRRPNP